jgi:hypothetical protein
MAPLDILKWLPLLIQLITDAPSFIGKIQAAIKQDRELTPGEEAARDAYIAATESAPWWQPND